MANKIIISRVINFDGITAKTEDMTYILKRMSSRSDSSAYWTDQQINSLIKEIKNSELSLMYIEPSFGAEGAFLYKNYSFEEINPKN